MKKLVFMVVALATLGLSQAQTTTVEGVALDNKVTVGESSLMLNGAGLREKFWIDLYVGGLYLPKKSSNASSIIAADEDQAIILHIVSKRVTSEKMIDAVNDGFDAATGGNTKSLDARIKKFTNFFLQDEIKEGDVIVIANVAGQGIMVMKNGKNLGTIDGLDFKKALFAIWLGNDPADGDVKDGMLGKS